MGTWWKTCPPASPPFAGFGLPAGVSGCPPLHFDDGYRFANANRHVVGSALLRQVPFGWWFVVFGSCFSTISQHNHCDDDDSFYSSCGDFIRLLWQVGHHTDALPPSLCPRRVVPHTQQDKPFRPYTRWATRYEPTTPFGEQKSRRVEPPCSIAESSTARSERASRSICARVNRDPITCGWSPARKSASSA